MRTAGVKRLIGIALDSLPLPHGEDIIDEVFHAIEMSPSWRNEYDSLCVELGKTTVNTWGGFYISAAEGGQSTRQVPAVKSTLLQSYSKLTPSHGATRRKRSEADAAKIMASHYAQNKASLPSGIRDRREFIIDLLIEGASVEEAFDLAVSELADSRLKP